MKFDRIENNKLYDGFDTKLTQLIKTKGRF